MTAAIVRPDADGMRTSHLLVLVLVASLAVPASASTSSADPSDLGGLAAAAADVGLRACERGQTSAATPPVVPFVTCAGEMVSFDGVEIDARLTFPADATGAVPLVLLLHGWTGDRRGWQWLNPDVRTDVPGHGRYLAEGYAVLATTARGFWASCSTLDQVADVNADGSTGPVEEDSAACARGWTHIAERDYEARDSQHALGLLVDADIADPDRLAVFGDSYGGGQAWQLATSLPWDTPGGQRIRLAAAVPRQAWTDLLDALAPSGREGRDRPLGVLRTSIVAGFWAAARAQAGYLASPYPQGMLEAVARYNTVDPTESHSFFDGWLAVFDAGEPYDAAAAAYMEDALAGKSALFADDYFSAVAAGEVEPTPVMALQGWTDPLFTASQTLRMYERLKEIRRDYPVHVAFADGGHFSRLRRDQWAVLDELGARFIVAHLSGGELPPPVMSMRASCSGTDDAVHAGSFDRLAPVDHVLVGAGSHSTSSLSADPVAERALDPVTNGFRACATTDRGPSGAARWSWRVPDGGLETLGLQRVSMTYALTGVDATLVARLWDVGPDGVRSLVTSGVYRIATLAGDPARGTAGFPLFGTHYRFEPGHRIELELSQTDAPYLRPNTTASALLLSDLELRLPMTRAPAA